MSPLLFLMFLVSLKSFERVSSTELELGSLDVDHLEILRRATVEYTSQQDADDFKTVGSLEHRSNDQYQSLRTYDDQVDIGKLMKELLKAYSDHLGVEPSNILQNYSGRLPEVLTGRGSPLKNCQKKILCRQEDLGKYRTIDGTCNNPEKSTLGSAKTPFNRWLPPTYDDGFDYPKIRGHDGFKLPEARTISRKIFMDEKSAKGSNTLYIMQFGQFLDHDFALTPKPHVKMFGMKKMIQCCREHGYGPLPFFKQHSACFPILVDNADVHFLKTNKISCLNFVRSQAVPKEQCILGPREQFTETTHFVDGSQIYGSTYDDHKLLRTFKSGKLIVKSDFPPRMEPDEECGNRTHHCFRSGDFRINEQPGLTMIHVLFLREHNRIAEILKNANGDWSDERIFQESRRLLVAKYQKIVYKDFLPIVLGKKMLRKHKLDFEMQTNYNKDIDPSIMNIFATAAFRFGHSLIPNHFEMMDSSGHKKPMNLVDRFFDPLVLLDNKNLDLLARGMASQTSNNIDTHFSSTITKSLFPKQHRQIGTDLTSLNIQRGRDHGIPAYVDWREKCGLRKATKWSDLEGSIPKNVIRRLRVTYRSVKDVDVFVGGISELSNGDGMIGSTFGCILGEQFNRLLYGDRYFYAHDDSQDQSFSAAQIKEIEKASLARMICDNSGVSSIQKNVFKAESDNNQIYNCSDKTNIPDVNLVLLTT